MPANVTSGGGYLRFIKSKTRPVLTAAEVNEITRKIESGRLVSSFKTNREHVQHVRNIVATKETNTSKTCPRCGSSMVMRKTKQGHNIGKKFWGCSSFPKCRSIINIT
jgi:ssDNA-binding Zn-finger/Zn-ribbon topoisomerase 1